MADSEVLYVETHRMVHPLGDLILLHADGSYLDYGVRVDGKGWEADECEGTVPDVDWRSAMYEPIAGQLSSQACVKDLLNRIKTM